ncbi:putative RNA methyltransferase [Alkalibacter mobilis]|uniref:putative RNA methyltransferase n=1 Tax=Alkalibacter mobilis TaxID=2787712 RepID=UPI0018A11122|nr:methyltransferase domain-containing protein [Alkalibacter mobilis]MBF7095535.1 methyltransferase domain-containing protein [Alkalibacter mobilis]
MPKISKIEAFINVIKNSENVFACPKCNRPLQYDGKGLKCINNHNFNISKKGYVNLLLGTHKSIYGKELYVSRKATADSGFFSTLTDELAKMVDELFSYSEELLIFDAGCGEGSITTELHVKLKNRVKEFHGGDIAKEGIALAGDNQAPILWSVCDLSALPYQDKSFDLVFNILSPSNYKEFSRVLKQNGLLVKVIPGKEYLREFREIFYKSTDKSEYSNLKVLDHFTKHMNLIKSKKLSYSITPDVDQLHNLINMTPLLIDQTPDLNQIRQLKKIRTISLDYEILVGNTI